nr:endonuclease [Pseudomonas sp. 2FE]
MTAISLPALTYPLTFEQAKVELRQKVFFDRNTAGDLYCGCNWQWMGRSGGRMDLSSCGYEVRAQVNRAQRLEWEHVTPAWVLGHQRQCWQKGGRENCAANDPVFRAMEADMHNLWPSVGEVNGDRSNFRYSQIVSAPQQYGACQTRVDFKQRVAEPRDEAKGQVARIYLYMHDRYGLSMAKQQQQLFSAWNRQYPVTTWELERDQRIARVMGHSNPFVTGERTWTIGQRPLGEGLAEFGEQRTRPVQQVLAAQASTAPAKAVIGSPVIGNRNSHVYHLPEGCPSYDKVGQRNRVEFKSAAAAESAGFKRAGNCR